MAEPAAPKAAEDDLLRMTAEVVSAYVSNNTLATGQLADVIQAVYNSLRGLEGQVAEPARLKTHRKLNQASKSKPSFPILKSSGRLPGRLTGGCFLPSGPAACGFLKTENCGRNPCSSCPTSSRGAKAA